MIPAGLIDFDGCGDGDRSLALPLWIGSRSVSTTYGVFGGYGVLAIDTARIFAALSHAIVGFHYNVRARGGGGPIIYFREGSTIHASLQFPSDGSIQIRGAAGTVLHTVAAGTWPLQVWGYIEVDIVPDDTGTFNLHVFGDPTPIATVSGDFRNGGTGVVDNVYWNFVFGGNDAWVDDWYAVDGDAVGAEPLHGARVGVRQPNSDDTAELTRSAGAANYATVDERPFSSTDYNETDVDGERDLYGVTDDGISFDVHAVRVIGQMRKSDASAAKGRLIIDDGAQGDGATRTLAAGSVVYADVFTAPPSGGSWDEAAVDSLLIGVERVAV